MAVEKLPARLVFTCDACAKKKEENEGCLRPAYWGNLNVLRDAYDFQGAACADASVKRLLCEECLDTAVHAINDASARDVAHAVAMNALLSIVDASREYLPPDGISKDEFINLVIGATDNPTITPLILAAESARG